MYRISYQKNHRLGMFAMRTNQEAGFMYVGKFNGFEVWCNELDDELSYDVVDNRNGRRKRVLELDLDYNHKMASWHVEIVRIDQRYRGMNLAPKFYRWIMRNQQITLQAGENQSPGGRYIWSQLAQMKSVSLIAIDSRGNQYEVHDEENWGELDSDDVQLYDSNRKVNVFAYYGGV